MAKLVQMNEAAEMLGISPEQLADLRSRNEIFGYRDGSTWKFKLEEIERVKNEKGLGDAAEKIDDAGDLNELVDVAGLSDADANADANEDFGLNLEGGAEAEVPGRDDDADVIEMSSDDEDSDSILVSEEELGQSDENTASTIIGEPDDLLPQDSALGSDALADASDLELSMERSDVIAASDIFDGGEDKPISASDTANLKIASASDVGDDVRLQDSGSIQLSTDDSTPGSRIELVGDEVQASSSGFGSAIDMGLDDDELVLGSGAGSDVTAGAGDSGISLGNPSDSGLSLEDPLELSSGSGAESLELGEDDVLDLDKSMAGATDDDFMLTPVEDGLDEESDSGSQVIALDSEDFGDSAVEMLTEEDEEAEVGTAEFMADDDAEVAGFGAVAMRTDAVPIGSAEDQDEGYSVWNVLSLFSIVAMLGFTGILMLDLINNMWSWNGNFSFNSSIMDALLGMMP
jgi:hypothetical protein